ncbi:MAG TPA: hypothetical protein PLK11_06710 [Methanofastidiosum sp.]|nr:hypothetical protein [Methanofastidiosum sp.]HOR88109.1 hypothetical protein [Methanofastidiosum sp.]HPL01017.1 hypothetical protein [Methanofastidiosum sp.]HPU91703.1 hypothetical protein [Methanofastidiosum sp.]HPX24181.1 hypothetical protein [Methanofastidiosum sp.]
MTKKEFWIICEKGMALFLMRLCCKEGAACSYLDLCLIHISNKIDGFDEELKTRFSM